MGRDAAFLPSAVLSRGMAGKSACTKLSRDQLRTARDAHFRPKQNFVKKNIEFYRPRQVSFTQADNAG